MSVSANIDLRLAFPNKPETFMMTDIQLLLSFGWSFNDGGTATYLPVGDNDNFDWQRVAISDANLLDILWKKEKSGELMGVAMTWQNTGIGGEFLFFQDGLISLNLSINRKKIKGYKYTDINWYIERIFPALNKDQTRIESFSYSEHI